ncbi:MAG TPA: PadR family transcriptional regulator [Gemmatimonadaceae bacterium]|nr:PadR family transcriptional regulator [Gemmatimonadaceae bacterium]
MSDTREVVQGTLDLLVLASLRAGRMHGWGISQRIRQQSREAVLVTTGSLYPALHRLEQRRLIRAEWRPSENNRRARYYELTAKGYRALGEELEWWERFVAGVAGVTGAAGAATGSA